MASAYHWNDATSSTKPFSRISQWGVCCDVVAGSGLYGGPDSVEGIDRKAGPHSRDCLGEGCLGREVTAAGAAALCCTE